MMKISESLKVRKESRAAVYGLCLYAAGVLLGSVAVLTGCGLKDRALVLSYADAGEGQNLQAAGEESAGQGAAGSKALQDGAAEGESTDSADRSAGMSGSGGADPASPSQSPSGDGGLVYVHVCGAVISPGVVELPAGSRAKAALEAAGGFSAEADQDYVNLASMVADGQQLYFPTRAEAEALREAEADREREELAAASGLVNINTANQEQLCTLPGIGEARALAIIDHREQNGSFETTEDIMQVSGIKQSAYDKIRDRITVD